MTVVHQDEFKGYARLLWQSIKLISQGMQACKGTKHTRQIFKYWNIQFTHTLSNSLTYFEIHNLFKNMYLPYMAVIMLVFVWIKNTVPCCSWYDSTDSSGVCQLLQWSSTSVGQTGLLISPMQQCIHSAAYTTMHWCSPKRCLGLIRCNMNRYSMTTHFFSVCSHTNQWTKCTFLCTLPESCN